MDGRIWEIVLGGWENKRSCVRGAKQADEVAFADKGPLHGNKHRTFWIKWTDHHIAVGEGSHIGHHQFMEGHSGDVRLVNRISVSTGWGSQGEWKFPNLVKLNRTFEAAGL